MSAAVLVTIIFFGAAAAARAARSPAAMTERASMTLVWLANHPRPGTRATRDRVASRARRRMFRGLRLAGVYSPFLCIHSHEGPWTIHNPPYDGGLQMDSGFQASYGSEYLRTWGSAGRWPVWAQLNAGYRAWRVRGYTPWPNTARACGLL